MPWEPRFSSLMVCTNTLRSLAVLPPPRLASVRGAAA